MPLKLEARFTKKSGLGMFALSDIEKHEKLISIKNSEVIESKSFRLIHELFPHSLKPLESLNLQNGYEKLVVTLAHHLYNIEKSEFKAWLILMPKSYKGLSIDLTDSTIDFTIFGTVLHRDALHEREHLIKIYQQISSELQHLSEIDRILLFNNRKTISFTDFCAIMYIIESRAWKLHGDIFLVPGTDFFNHKFNPNHREYNIQGHAFQMHHKALEDSYGFFQSADRHSITGKQIFESYYIENHSQYLLIHGFLPKITEKDCFEIPLFGRDESHAMKHETRKLIQYSGVTKYHVCIAPHEESFKRIEVFGNIFEFNREEVVQCMNFVGRHHPHGLSAKLNLILEHCPQKSWDTRDLSINVLIAIESEIESGKVILERVLNMEKSKQRDSLEEYFRRRIEAGKELKQMVQNLKEKKILKNPGNNHIEL